ncbi:enoyl-CoA hydratase/isomerase family protein [Temperatibacter marinus]|uniref:Enoyl-CoA hydratase/isomerase family protein n=1 Tax=Temperatibacter marinus TaxID=1456591 RepID=A0AA52HAA6_9PROT|nr:enoyl-CoA hydratase/isomerase family protein [Temperatibacter marinus]WND02540.1 enoyl-CoA hydratase/isomerase family protein [Temperatibacter marinus]
MTDLEIKIENNGLAFVTLNRPEVNNAFNASVIDLLNEAFTSLGQNKDVHVIILSGNGKNFSAGADLNWMKQAASFSEEENVQDAIKLADMLSVINTCPKPVIGVIQGVAMGGGVGLTSVVDIAIGAPSTKFALSEVKLGLTPATISPYVVAAIGSRQARRLFLTAERFDAQAALAYGLLHDIAEDPMSEAIILAEALLNNAPAAMADAKKLIADVDGQPITAELRHLTAQRIAARRKSDEGKEGLDAFLSKRKPNWSAPS